MSRVIVVGAGVIGLSCAVRLLEGEVKMLRNDVLEDEDLAEGIRLGCQSVPVTDTVSVTYH